MKVKITAKEFKRIYFEYGAINSIPSEIELEGEPIVCPDHDDKCFVKPKKIEPIPEWMRCSTGCNCRTCNIENKVNEIIKSIK